MADDPTVDTDNAAPAEDAAPAKKTTTRKTAAKTAAKKAPATKTAAKKTTAKKTTAKRTTKRAAAPADEALPGTEPAPEPVEPAVEASVDQAPEGSTEAADAPAQKSTTRKTAAKKTAAKKAPAKKTTAKTTAKKTTAKRTTAKRTTAKTAEAAEAQIDAPTEAAEQAPEAVSEATPEPSAAPAVLFQVPDAKPVRKRALRRKATPVEEPPVDEAADEAAEVTGPTEAAEPPAEQPVAEPPESDEQTESESDESQEASEGGSGGRRRRRRGGRRRRKSGGDSGDASEASDADTADTADTAEDAEEQSETSEVEEQSETTGTSRRRRRRRRAGDADADDPNNLDNPPNTVTRVRQGRSAEDQITALSGSTRLEAKKQRRREGREAGRRRAPIVSEAEFLARRESVDRVMVIRQRDDLTQIAVLEDKVLVEHYVARESQTSLIGNVYLGRVQNVLPSMEAAFIDIGKGRNAVLYAGEVNWSSLGWKDGQPRKIESVLTSGQKVLVQVTKDPIGHKGARLTSQISLAGRFLVYVPDGTTSGISRKLPDTERNRLKSLLKEIVPDSAGVIVRTAAEGASEEELTRDVERLKARWEDIEKKAGGNAPQLLYGEPDLTLKVVRDLFTEDFSRLVIQGEDAWDTVQGYVSYVAPDLAERLEKYEPENGVDAFAAYRIDEQIAKGLDRKVWLPSGGSLIIDRTEAMTVVDVNTGKFTGSGGNLEETVTKNNLEAAEEIVRQLRLRDIGGIIVVDFIDMVLESNRDLVLRRLVECLGRDRTRHQVAEVTSLGLVQMTRKRIGTGLLEAFSETCEHCGGRGLVIHDHPVEPGKSSGVAPDEPRGRRRRGRGKGGNDDAPSTPPVEAPKTPSPAEFAAMAGQTEPTEEPAEDVAGRVASASERIETSTIDSGGLDTPSLVPRDGYSTSDEVSTNDEAEPVEASPVVEPASAASGVETNAADSVGLDTDSLVPHESGSTSDEPEPASAASGVETNAAAQEDDGVGLDTDSLVPHESGSTSDEPEPASAETGVETNAADSVGLDTDSLVPHESGSTSDGAEPEKPKVVTRTRRRSASRPAGSPDQSGEVQPMVVEAHVVVPTAEPVSVPEPPKVVTRTRRGASRPAGATASEEAPAAVLVAEAGGETDEVHVEHVPVKKKGSRKR